MYCQQISWEKGLLPGIKTEEQVQREAWGRRKRKTLKEMCLKNDLIFQRSGK